jgi:hypothetical protein
MSAPFEFSVDDPQGQRFEMALQSLRDGRPITYRGVSISLHDSKLLDCGVITQWAPANVTEAIARAEMLSGKQTIDALVAESPSFARLVAGREMRLSLISWDGMAYTVHRLEGKV